MPNLSTELDINPNAGPGARRAAAVVLALGPELAKGVLGHLDEKDMRVLAQGARSLRNAEPAAMTSALRAYVENLGGFGTDMAAGDGLLRDLVANALGLEAAERAFSREELPPPADTLLAPLLAANPDDIALLLGKERAQVAALILGALPGPLATTIFQRLPDDQRSDVVQSIAKLTSVSTEVLHDLIEGLVAELKDLGSADGRRTLDGFASAVELIRGMQEQEQQNTLSAIEEQDAELADKFKSKIFVFDDIAALMDRDVQMILKDVDISTLTVALKSASVTVKEKIMANMSTRVAQMLLDDLATLGPVRLSEVEEAREQVAQMVIQLAADGKITLVGGGEEML